LRTGSSLLKVISSYTEMTITRSKRELLSKHTSNPFDDADPLKRACGWGSSELSLLSSASDLGGYGEVGDITICVEAPDETKGYAEGGGDEDCLTLRDDIDIDDVNDTWDNPEQCPDDEMNTSDDWDEDEFEEENSISFKSTAEQEEIRDEMTDLENVVPQLKTDYELLDRLGTGRQLLFLILVLAFDLP
jgi:cell division control protein 7